MAVVLFDGAARARWYPLTYTKAVAAIRMGIFTIQERWQQLLKEAVFINTVPYLQPLYPAVSEGIHTWINACIVPTQEIIDKIKGLQQGEVVEDATGIIACKAFGKNITDVLDNSAMMFTTLDNVEWLQYPHQLLHWNKHFIQFDYQLLTNNKTSQPLSSTNRCLHPENIFIDENASVEFAIINASEGPVYIGKNAVVMEGSLLKGPIAIGDNAVVKMGSKIYSATTIGPYCTAGGEIKNAIMQAYSNKAHDGYLGDSVIGEWCNFGAGASNSNVKNTAGNIMLWNDYDEALVNAGNKCGVIMGDYTRVAINSSINTGSVYGICCNVFGEGLLPKKLQNFAWGINGENYKLESAVQHIKQWKHFKHQSLSVEEESVLTYIFEQLLSHK